MSSDSDPCADVAGLRGALLDAAAAPLGADAMGAVRLACTLAERAHAGQTRDEGTPYVLHPFRVASMVAHDLAAIQRDPVVTAAASPCEILAIALLHDVLEDAPDAVAPEEWQALGPRVLPGVELLTRGGGRSKQAYYRRLLDGPAHTRLVKLADRIDNLASIRLSPVAGKRERKVSETRRLVLPLADGLPSPVLLDYGRRLRDAIHHFGQA